MLILAKSTLSGNIMGKPVEGFVLDKGADAAPAPGEYDLQPPMDDPIFGSYIIAVRRGIGFKPGRDWRKLPTGSGLALQFEIQDFRTPELEKGVSSEALFALCKQPIPGRNCVVLAAGFSDLLDAMRDAREAVLTVI